MQFNNEIRAEAERVIKRELEGRHKETREGKMKCEEIQLTRFHGVTFSCNSIHFKHNTWYVPVGAGTYWEN